MANETGGPPKSLGLGSRVKAPSPLGTAIFLALRSADLPLQYSMFHAGWGAKLIQTLGGSTVSQTGRLYLGLTPYSAILTALAVGTTVKQSVWVTAVSEQEMRPLAACFIAAMMTVSNTLSSLLSIWTVTSMSPAIASAGSIMDVCSASPIVSLGLGLYSVGMVIEFFSEIQRKRFKENPANKGKPYGGGLFSLATHINYGGYTVWRIGYAIVAAGLPWGLFTAGLTAHVFTTSIIPELDDYCTRRVCLLCFSISTSIFMFYECWREMSPRCER